MRYGALYMEIDSKVVHDVDIVFKLVEIGWHYCEPASGVGFWEVNPTIRNSEQRVGSSLLGNRNGPEAIQSEMSLQTEAGSRCRKQHYRVPETQHKFSCGGTHVCKLWT
jgi:hypothetical protein